MPDLGDERRQRSDRVRRGDFSSASQDARGTCPLLLALRKKRTFERRGDFVGDGDAECVTGRMGLYSRALLFVLSLSSFDSANDPLP